MIPKCWLQMLMSFLGGKNWSLWLHSFLIYTQRGNSSENLSNWGHTTCWYAEILFTLGVCLFLPFMPQHTSFARSPVSQYPKSFAFHPPSCNIGCVLRCICQDLTHTEVVPVWRLCKFSLCSQSSRKAKSFLPTPLCPHCMSSKNLRKIFRHG